MSACAPPLPRLLRGERVRTPIGVGEVLEWWDVPAVRWPRDTHLVMVAVLVDGVRVTFPHRDLQEAEAMDPVSSVLVYRDVAGEWRWTASAANGRKVANSGEGYQHRADCVDAARSIFPGAELVYADRTQKHTSA